MVGCLGQSRPAQDADVVARAVAAVALTACCEWCTGAPTTRLTRVGRSARSD